MTDSNQKPLVPNYTPDVGRLVTDRYDFQEHIDGTGFRQKAGTIDLSPSVTVGSNVYSNAQDVIAALAAATVVPTVPSATNTSLGLIQLSGDIGGSNIATTPRVSGLQGRPVSSIAPTTGYVLTWNGSQWVPQTPSISPLGGDLTGSTAIATVIKLQGFPIATATPTTNKVLGWNGSAWTPSNVTQIQGTIVSATSPVTNQVLQYNGTTWSPATASITGVPAGGDLTGTYTNPTIAKLQGITLTASTPLNGQNLQYNGSAWVPGDTANAVLACTNWHAQNGYNSTPDVAGDTSSYCWYPFTGSWIRSEFYPGMSAFGEWFSSHDGGITWTRVGSLTYGFPPLSMSANNDSFFQVETDGSVTQVTYTASSANVSVIPHALTDAQIDFVNVTIGATTYVASVWGIYQTGSGTYTGYWYLMDSTFIWHNNGAALPSAFSGGSGHYDQVFYAQDGEYSQLQGSPNYPLGTTTTILVAFTDPAGLSRSKLMLINTATGVATDVTPPFLGAFSVAGIAYNAANQTWGIMSFFGSGSTWTSLLFSTTTPSSPTSWTATTNLVNCQVGGLACIGRYWVTYSTGCTDMSADNNNRIFYSNNNGTTWYSGDLALIPTLASHPNHFGVVLSNGVQLLVGNTGNVVLSHQIGVPPVTPTFP